jgi:copper(I)-binding protein
VAVIRSARRVGRSLGAGWVLLAAGAAVALAGCAAGQYAQTSQISPSIDGASGQVGAMSVHNVALAYPDSGQYEQGSDARLLFTLVNLGSQDDALVEVRSDAASGVTFSAGSAAGSSATASGAASTPAATAPSTPAATTPAATPTATPLPTGSSTASASASVSPSASASASAPTSASVSGSASATPTEQTLSPIAIPAGQILGFRDTGPTVTLTGLKQMLRPSTPLQVTFVFQRAGELTLTVPVGVPLTEVSQPPTIDINSTGGG